MLTGVNGVIWMEDGVGGEGAEDGVSSWTRNNSASAAHVGMGESKDGLGLSSFKSMLDDDWYFAAAASGTDMAATHADPSSQHGFGSEIDASAAGAPPQVESLMQLHHHHHHQQQHQAVVDSSSCSQSPAFGMDHSQAFFPEKSAISSLISTICSSGHFDAAAPFDLGCDATGFLTGTQMSNSPFLLNRGGGGGAGGSGGVLDGFGALGPSGLMGGPDLSPTAVRQFHSGVRLLPLPEATASGFAPSASFGGLENSPFLNRNKVLRPLEMFPPVGAQPTLFQKRAAALRQNSSASGGEKSGSLGYLGLEGGVQGSHGGSGGSVEEHEKRKRGNDEDEMDEVSIDGSGINYDSDEAGGTENKTEDNGNNGGGNNSNANSAVTGGGGEQKGKKKGMPAKNLMAERRRRKKLNDRLYMLRSVVPKISKMDRASILGDAIEYLKELLQRINDLHNELESTPSSSSLPTSSNASFHPLTPTPPTLPCRVKEELGPSSLPSPNSQPARVEVRLREGRAVNIHMFCARRPGLLLSTMRALDGMGLDIQQAVISCFNGFALDIFRAEQCKDGPGVHPEEIKSVLLHSAGSQGAM